MKKRNVSALFASKNHDEASLKQFFRNNNRKDPSRSVLPMTHPSYFQSMNTVHIPIVFDKYDPSLFYIDVLDSVVDEVHASTCLFQFVDIVFQLHHMIFCVRILINLDYSKFDHDRTANK